jgi:hypothetical protein
MLCSCGNIEEDMIETQQTESETQQVESEVLQTESETLEVESEVKDTETEVFNEEEAENSISKNDFVANGKVIAELESEYAIPTTVGAKCAFYDSENNAVDYSEDIVSYLEKGNKTYLLFDETSSEYSSYEIKYEYSKSWEYTYSESVIDNLSMDCNYIDDEYYPYVIVEVFNNGELECTDCDICVVFYDENGNIIDVERSILVEIQSGDSDILKVEIPYDVNTFENLKYSRYEAFISTAEYLEDGF